MSSVEIAALLASGLFVAICSIFITWYACRGLATQEDPRLPIGSKGWLYNGLFESSNLWLDLNSAQEDLSLSQNDRAEGIRLLDSGKETLVPNFTEVEVLEHGEVPIQNERLTRVNIVGGPFKGKTGWVSSSHVESGEPPAH